MSLRPNVKIRLWSRIRTGPIDQCWPWDGGTVKGYGVLKVDGRTRYAHQLVLEDFGCPSNYTLHSCDNPRCCNPTHISKGTHQQNMKDMFARNRRKNTAKGSQIHTCKLTPAKVKRIRALAEAGARPRELADRFDVTKPNIRSILRRETWKWV